jgi:hypothetical protein
VYTHAFLRHEAKMKDENGDEYECNILGCPKKATKWLEGSSARVNVGPICQGCLDTLCNDLRHGIGASTKKPVQHLPKRMQPDELPGGETRR